MADKLDREVKRQKILGVARGLFTSEGYDAASMSRIAKHAGVAPNTIYWYFDDKDALLIAVLGGMVSEVAEQYQRKRAQTGLTTRLVWLLGVLEGVQGLIATVHARVTRSEAIRTWHEHYHVMFEAMLTFELRDHGVDPKQLKQAAQVSMFVIEGLLAHPASQAKRRKLVEWMVSTLESGAMTPAPG